MTPNVVPGSHARSGGRNRLHSMLTRIAALGLAAAAALIPPAGRADENADADFTPIFNGKDLSGWSGDMTLWRVEDGVIIGDTTHTKIKRNTFLSTDKTYGDFVLRISWMLENHNSGVQFRSQRFPDHVIKGYQADLAEKDYTGMIYEEGLRGFMPYWKDMTPEKKAEINAVAKLKVWNTYVITCQGSHLKVELNGVVTADFDDPEGAKSGHIALQLHAGPGMIVRFKDIKIRELKPKTTARVIHGVTVPQLLPDQTARVERAAHEKRRFTAPEGFEVQEVASAELVGSVVNMTFDAEGRPMIAVENGPIFTLIDANGDGVYDEKKVFADQIKTAHGMHFVGPGDLLVHSNGPSETALYRLRDEDKDGTAERIDTLEKSRGGIGEHGPHAIRTGLDGDLYIEFGNHSYPDMPIDPASPSRGLQEDQFLPRYVDPRGHATNIRAPGGTIHRVDLGTNSWSQFCGGFRNAFDFDINEDGELFTFDSDMEWDLGLPWYREIRVVHCVAGGDYGWRTGSGKFPPYYVDTLPALEDIGRGSPVGVAFYDHNVYPEIYHGALFLGDWSRGRIRVLFSRRDGATYAGGSTDFVLGEPLNVTDLEVGPDGSLYFATGGRSTTGGLYRVRYASPVQAKPAPADPVEAALAQVSHRSAWGKAKLAEFKSKTGDAWGARLKETALDANGTARSRVRALEYLQTLGPQPDADLLAKALADPAVEVRAAAALLLGKQPYEKAAPILTKALGDADPWVQRRACDSLVRAGLEKAGAASAGGDLIASLLNVMNGSDRFARSAARTALSRLDRDSWKAQILNADLAGNSNLIVEGMIALIHTGTKAEDSDEIFARLHSLGAQSLNDNQLLAYLRLCQLALIRDAGDPASRADFKRALGERALAKYPSANGDLTRELEFVLAYCETPGALDKMLNRIETAATQEDQIHTAYALRVMKENWSREQRDRFIAWFDRGREYGGGASLEGFVQNIWKDALANLPSDEERALAEARRQKQLDDRAAKAQALVMNVEGDRPGRSDLAQMSFTEIAEYLELDPMTYEKGSADRGRKVFHRAKCASCHIFGNEGKGGGPDLSNVIKRFRRREILDAIMNPSKVISDQYQTVNVETADDVLTGFIGGETDDTLTLINANGERIDIPKANIKDKRPSQVSIMPEGLLGAMTMGELVDLILFLERGAGV